MKRSSTLLVTPSPTAREEKAGGRAGEHVCQMDGWRRREKGCNDGSGVVRSTAKNEPHRSTGLHRDSRGDRVSEEEGAKTKDGGLRSQTNLSYH